MEVLICLFFSLVMLISLTFWAQILLGGLHPMFNLFYLLLYVIMLSFFVSYYFEKSLVSYMIMMAFSSGLMILFSYFISLLNKSLSLDKFLYFYLISFFVAFVFYFLINYLFSDLLFKSLSLKDQGYFMVSYYNNEVIVFIFMILYLILVLFLCYRISQSKVLYLRSIM